MVATPKTGIFFFRGLVTKKTYIKEIYVSDVANALVTFDAGAGASATSPDFIKFPEDVVLEDYSMITGTADTTKIRLVRDGVPTGNILTYANFLSTLAKRPALTFGIKAGQSLRAFQLA